MHFIICVAWIASCFVQGLKGEIRVNKIVAKVNQVAITEKTLEMSLEPCPEKINPKVWRRQALDRLIDQQLILQEFEQRKGKILGNQLNSQIQSIIRQNFKGNREAFLRYLNQQNRTFSSFEKDIQQSMIVYTMQQQNVSSLTNISPADIEAYYQEHIQDYLLPESVLLEQFGFKANSSLQKGEEMVTKISILNESLSSPEKYAATCQELDEFHLGKIWYASHELASELNQVAFRLSPNTYSKPILYQETYFILHVLEKKPAKVKPLKEVQQQIEEQLLVEANAQAYNDWIKKLRQKAFVEYLD